MEYVLKVSENIFRWGSDIDDVFLMVITFIKYFRIISQCCKKLLFGPLNEFSPVQIFFIFFVRILSHDLELQKH